MDRLDITKERTAILEVRHAWASEMRGPRICRTDSRAGDGFVLILGGACEYRFDSGEGFLAEAGDLLYLASGDAYTMRLREGEYRYICVNFLFADARRRKSTSARLGTPRECEAALRRLVRLFPSGKDAYFEEMALVYGIYRELTAARRTDYVGRSARESVLLVKEYMEQHYADSALDGRTLAEMAGMSEPYFRLIFKRLLHTSPLSYMLSLRLTAAEELMQYPDLPLSEIARSCGFSSLTYFCRVFKAHRGISPAKYRRERLAVRSAEQITVR